jgi:hypothetical protein
MILWLVIWVKNAQYATINEYVNTAIEKGKKKPKTSEFSVYLRESGTQKKTI